MFALKPDIAVVRYGGWVSFYCFAVLFRWSRRAAPHAHTCAAAWHTARMALCFAHLPRTLACNGG
jgi:hypothetical protein